MATFVENGPDNNEDMWNIARFWRNPVSTAIKSYKSDKIKAELRDNQSSPKKFWSNIKELLLNSKDI